MKSELKGQDKIIGILNRLADEKDIKNTLQAGGMIIKSYLAQYPPSTDANSPANKTWYKRNDGQFRRRKDGSIVRLSTSETLGKRWTVQVKGLTVTVGNNAKYAKYVQSDESQARFHRSRGWRTDQMALETEGEKVVELFRGVMRSKMNG